MYKYALQAILIFNVVEFTPLSYGDYVLPDWSQALGWLMAVASVAVIPIFAIYQFITLSRQSPYSQLSFCQVYNIQNASKADDRRTIKSVDFIVRLSSA